jgi:hypothetical protein
VFRIDITKCEQCEGPVKIITCIEAPVVIEQILRHLRDTVSLGIGLLFVLYS